MTKLIVNLYGGPGSGKSTMAAGLFSFAKNMGINAELVQEAAKDWAWERRPITSTDQLCLLAEQCKRERRLVNDCDLIITDSPILLQQYYEEKYSDYKHLVAPGIIQWHQQIMKSFKPLHVFVNRVKPFNPEGRLHTEEQSTQIDEELLTFLLQHANRYPHFVTGDDAGLVLLSSKILKRFKYVAKDLAYWYIAGGEYV